MLRTAILEQTSICSFDSTAPTQACDSNATSICLNLRTACAEHRRVLSPPLGSSYRISQNVPWRSLPANRTLIFQLPSDACQIPRRPNRWLSLLATAWSRVFVCSTPARFPELSPRLSSIPSGDSPYETKFGPGLSLICVCESGPLSWAVPQPFGLLLSRWALFKHWGQSSVPQDI